MGPVHWRELHAGLRRGRRLPYPRLSVWGDRARAPSLARAWQDSSDDFVGSQNMVVYNEDTPSERVKAYDRRVARLSIEELHLELSAGTSRRRGVPPDRATPG
jgi:hypothetical protein